MKVTLSFDKDNMTLELVAETKSEKLLIDQYSRDCANVKIQRLEADPVQGYTGSRWEREFRPVQTRLMIYKEEL